MRFKEKIDSLKCETGSWIGLYVYSSHSASIRNLGGDEIFWPKTNPAKHAQSQRNITLGKRLWCLPCSSKGLWFLYHNLWSYAQRQESLRSPEVAEISIHSYMHMLFLLRRNGSSIVRQLENTLAVGSICIQYDHFSWLNQCANVCMIILWSLSN